MGCWDRLPLGLASVGTGRQPAGLLMLAGTQGSATESMQQAGVGARRQGGERADWRIVGCGEVVGVRGWPTPTIGLAWRRPALCKWADDWLVHESMRPNLCGRLKVPFNLAYCIFDCASRVNAYGYWEVA